MFGSLDSCHDRAAASVIHCMRKNSLQASVCVFSDRMMAHQHLEFVAGQWLRSAIPDSQQPTSPIGFLFLKLPPPPCAVLLVSVTLR